ncbi:hypothetical protein AB834_06980 [PVC group bacterium (ex Bugula neritina AB1)]|nr:hypothetical protein AB834_06975 [PVC group bacterium (ex Bugula neritina AB1)]OED34350.1 hypothetical protein AB834_06980 [PVC group bacterium (ex Bugula neritina AB1)]
MLGFLFVLIDIEASLPYFPLLKVKGLYSCMEKIFSDVLLGMLFDGKSFIGISFKGGCRFLRFWC